ncbi:conserved hypothetical protein [Desulfosarcina cetonica]|uniref:hypothetical protein n=1 Tax=Desulfosarcina cetonica TaxID=90730 RepID=UPI0006D2977D|nr:hypothetical protein [Desulfosarcina cetonica]VTR69042.1 conserved hypothetical protein [Desulfosarcina cetonica]
MNYLLSDADKKKSVFDSMSPKRQKYIIEKVGYDKWDPFEKPKDPIDIRRDKSKRTAQMLVREFLQSKSMDQYSNNYGRGVLDMAIGIVNDDDRYIAMYDFALWHNELIRKEQG